MPEPRTCHSPNNTALACIGSDRPGLAKAVKYYDTDFVISDITELEGQR